MNSWEDAPWRGGRAGGYSRRPLEGDPVKGSSSKSVRDPPPLWGPQGRNQPLSEIIYFETLPFCYNSSVPELPEVETIVAGLRPKLTGLVIQDIRVSLPSLLRKDRTFRLQKIRGRRIEAVRRRGKLILVECQDRIFMIFHLKMTGRLFWTSHRTPADRHTHLIVSFRGRADELRFRDVRKFGFLRCLEASDPLECQELCDLGPEPVDLDLDSFVHLFRGRKGRLKSLLLNQTFLAGIGNIYADEILFEAELHPLTPAASLTRKQKEKLWTAMRHVLRRAIAAGGSSIRDFRNAEGAEGLFQQEHRVYGRASLPCPRCGTKIRSLKIGGRTSSFCPRCQRTTKTFALP
jgi:formamidopyrimidine-DNA glycosylase